MSDKAVKFGAVGDIMFSGHIGALMKEKGAAWAFDKMLPHLKRADLLFGNMESMLLPPDYPLDRVDPQALASPFDGTAALAAAGFGFLNLAQNHVLDGGTISMFHTRDAIEKRGIPTGGIGRTQEEARRLRVVERGGLSFGFLCYAEDSNYTLGTAGPCHAYYTRQALLEDIRKHRGSVDVLVVSVHADIEFMETPSVPRRAIFREAADAGATIVLGHHPHVPQGIERRGKSLIAYSLGNFLFEAHSSGYQKNNGPHTADTFLLLVDVTKEGVVGFERVPGRIPSIEDERPVPLEGAEKQELLDYLADLDRKALDDEHVRRVWRAKALQYLEIYLKRAQGWSREQFLSEVVGRLLLTAENRSWLNEVVEAAKEKWEEHSRGDYSLHRPNFVIGELFKK